GSSTITHFWKTASDFGGQSSSFPSSRYLNDFDELQPIDMLRTIHSSEDTSMYEKIVSAIFDEDTLSTKDNHENVGRLKLNEDDTSSTIFADLDTANRDLVVDIAIEVCRQHCAKHLEVIPIRMLGDCPQVNRYTVKLLTHGGDMVEFCHELRFPFVKWIIAKQKSSPPGAVGTSIALETILLHSSVDSKSYRNDIGINVLVCSRGGGGLLVERMELVAELWEENIKAEFVPLRDPSLTEQYEYASEHDIKCLIVITDSGVSQKSSVK
ncbi:UNVERIFIED_CONTAM: eIF-2-alpha kinase GCN2, partial [Sesamum indicum]